MIRESLRSGVLERWVRQPQALAVHPSIGAVNSVADLIALVKQKPGIGCATSGVGSNQHVLLEWFAKQAAIKLDHVPYRGAGQAINDLIAGHVQIIFESLNSIAPHARSGKVRALAVSGARRSPGFPELPTIAEAGVPGYEAGTWSGVIAPAKLPPAILARLNAAVNEAIRSPIFTELAPR